MHLSKQHTTGRKPPHRSAGHQSAATKRESHLPHAVRTLSAQHRPVSRLYTCVHMLLAALPRPCRRTTRRPCHTRLGMTSVPHAHARWGDHSACRPGKASPEATGLAPNHSRSMTRCGGTRGAHQSHTLCWQRMARPLPPFRPTPVRPRASRPHAALSPTTCHTRPSVNRTAGRGCAASNARAATCGRQLHHCMHATDAADHQVA